VDLVDANKPENLAMEQEIEDPFAGRLQKCLRG
jgi:hypothetical protein